MDKLWTSNEFDSKSASTTSNVSRSKSCLVMLVGLSGVLRCRYVVAHVVGRRAMYPGSTAILQKLIGNMSRARRVGVLIACLIFVH